MGYASYNTSSASTRSTVYQTMDTNQIFTQQTKRKASEEMDIRNVGIREAKDSQKNPLTFPIILGLDQTGSMSKVPVQIIKECLPHIISGIIAGGVPSPSVLFMLIGDHESDHYPLQVGQFENGDEEMEKWLKLGYLEENGGANSGESYGLAWWFAANRTVSDHWEKRGKKGVVITVGDEPNLQLYPESTLQSWITPTGYNSMGTITADQLYREASQKYHIHHIHYAHHSRNTMGVTPNDKMVDSINGLTQMLIQLVVEAYKAGADVVVQTPYQESPTPSEPKDFSGL